MILNLVVIFVVVFGYPALVRDVPPGPDFGKLLCGLRVVTTEGAPVRFRHAALRSIFSVAEIYLTFGTLAVTSIVLTRDNQRLGDVFAGTIVLRERTGESRAIAVRFPAPPGYEEYVMRLDTSGVIRDLYLVVRRFLMRVGELTPAARGRRWPWSSPPPPRARMQPHPAAGDLTRAVPRLRGVGVPAPQRRTPAAVGAAARPGRCTGARRCRRCPTGSAGVAAAPPGLVPTAPPLPPPPPARRHRRRHSPPW